MQIMSKKEVLSVLRDFKKNNAEKYGILDIGIFGSVARDEAQDQSDIDICIKVKIPNPFILVHIKEDIESRINKRVDIVRVRDKMNKSLKERIEREGVYV